MGFMAAFQTDGAHNAADLGRQAADAIAALPQTTIAAIHGHCVGGGVVLAAACDLRVAAQSARFSLPELELGIPLARGGMERLVALVGETLAVDLVLTCRPFDAQEAKTAGFLTRVVSDDALDDEIKALGQLIASRPAGVLRTTKSQLQALRAGTFDPKTDAQALLNALQDPETLAAAQTYLTARLNR